MSRKLYMILGVCILSLGALSAQNDTINQLDSQGRKQGYWQKEYPNGKAMYHGYFTDGEPSGVMRRYYESGELKVVMKYRDNGDYNYTRFFYEDGELAGEGLYYQNTKDSLWTYYSYYSGSVTSTEEYVKGIKHGMETNYYPNGQKSEEIQWEKNIKNGVWNQYFDDGVVKLKASYSFNAVNGLYTFYWPNGNLYILGNYADNKRHGIWSFFTDDGKKKDEIVYQYGKAENEEELTEKDQEFFKMVDENIGKFEDPTIEDVYPSGY